MALPEKEAIKEAIVEVWGSHPDYSKEQIKKTLEDWVGVHPDSGPSAILSVFHEVGTAPPEPWNYFQGSGPDNDLETWKRVSELASQKSGVDMYLESINPARSVFVRDDFEWPSARWKRQADEIQAAATRGLDREENPELTPEQELLDKITNRGAAATPSAQVCSNDDSCPPRQECKNGKCKYHKYLPDLKRAFPRKQLVYQSDNKRAGYKKGDPQFKKELDKEGNWTGEMVPRLEGYLAWLKRVNREVEDPVLARVAMEQLAWEEKMSLKKAILSRMKKERRKDLYDEIGGLSNPSKMPGFALGIPADKCQTGRLYFDQFHNPGFKKDGSRKEPLPTVCAFCYALKGNYVYPSNAASQNYRFDRLGLKRSPGEMEDAKKKGRKARWDNELSRPGLAKWANKMVEILEFAYGPHPHRGGERQLSPAQQYFRWHDSGDIQCEAHLEAIFDVAEATPYLAHWIPTREIAYVKRVTAKRKVPENMVVRLSYPTIGGRFSQAESYWERGGITASSVRYDNTCPAPSQEGACLGCRLCWDRSVADVAYFPH